MRKKHRLDTIPVPMIHDKMRFENVWWVTGAIDDELKKLTRRPYFDLFYPLILESDIKRAVVLMGPRRVGKTVMLHHGIDQLIDEGYDRQKICFIGIDNPLYLNIPLETLFAHAREAAGNLDPKGWMVFFDEIQYLKDWEIHLKVLVDQYPHSKFVVSGSAAAALKLKSRESGAGRFTEFMLPPLTFHEYIVLKGLNHLIKPGTFEWKGNLTEYYDTVNIRELNKHFVHYINYGGYPEVIFSEKIQSNSSRYIKNDIIDKVLLRDLPSLYGIDDVQELNSFFTMLAYNSANEVSLEALSRNSGGVDKNLIKKYLTYLEAAFLIKVIHRIDDNLKKFQRATFYKVYLTNTSLRSALFSPMDSTDDLFGNMVETAVFSQWMHREWFRPWYARWSKGRTRGEVDMVGLDKVKMKPQWALEIKWSNRYFDKTGELKSLLYFCKKNKLQSALVTSIDKKGNIEIDGLDISFQPASVYAYAVGANTLKQKSMMTNKS